MNLRDILHHVSKFEWNEANISHIAIHEVLPEEAEDVFFDTRNVLSDDVKHSAREKRFVIIRFLAK